MREKYRNALMWALYALLFMLVSVFQTVLFGRPRFFGVKLALLPVALGCITMHASAENGALFGLFAGLFWMLTGADLGPACILLYTLCGALCGYLCDRYLRRHILTAIFMSIFSLLLCQVPLFLLKCYLGDAYLQQFPSVFVQIGLSLLACPLLYLAGRAIRKAGV